jgi:Fur family ferric uptake transcriptional regulator
MNSDTLKENFIKFLKRQGLKNTPERLQVLEVISSLDHHFDIEELSLILERNKRRVSRATVYRTIELLVKGGFIKRVIYADRQARYEWNYQVKYHEHLICKQCGRILEFYSAEMEKLKGLISEKLGFRPIESHVEIHGNCREFERTGTCPHYEQAGSEPAREERIIRIDEAGEIEKPGSVSPSDKLAESASTPVSSEN